MMWWWLSLVVFVAAAGLVFPSFVIVYAVTSGWDATGQYIGLVVAGAIQGFLLGLGQVIALRRGPLRVPILRWILVTTVASAVSWLIGLVPGSIFRPDWTNPSVVFGMIAVILLVIVLVPISQWTLLRPVVRDAWRWIPIAAIAFAVAIGIFLSGLFLIHGATKVVTTMLTFSVMGWLGVVAYTLITGGGLAWMAREAVNPAGGRSETARKPSAARSKASAVAGKVKAKVGAKVSPAAKKVGSTAKSAAKKVGSKTVSTAKKATSTLKKKPGASSAQGSKSSARKSSTKKG